MCTSMDRDRPSRQPPSGTVRATACSTASEALRVAMPCASAEKTGGFSAYPSGSWPANRRLIACTSPDVEGDVCPAPGIDVEPHRGERLNPGIHGDPGLVVVPAELAAHDAGRIEWRYRLEEPR